MHTTSTTVSITRTHWLLPLFALWLACLTAPALAGQRIALVIGNGAYQHDKVLPNPRNDADGMVQVLQRLGFQVTQGKDLAKSAMERTVLEFGRQANGADIALVYYAGHGLEVAGKNYLLPVDARLPDELALRTEAIDLELILEAVAPARTRLLFMDACRNNPLANNMRMRTTGRSVGRGLGRVEAVSNTLIAFATAPGTVAADGQGRNSPFANALMANLEKPGLEIQQVMREVRRSVAQATQNQQVPWESSQLFDAVVLKPGAPTQMASVLPEPVRPVQPSTTSQPPAQAATPAGQAFKDCREAHCPELVVIPAGSFTMGSNDGDADEKPQRSVSVRSFALGKYEVTQGQWKAVMGSNPSTFKACGDNCPVEQVSWDDIQQYLSRLNAMTGQRYRLASEAEWEYAARAGSTTKYWWGDTASHEYANYGKDQCCEGHAEGKDRWVNTAPVGQFPANGFGLHDMHGNVWEWLQDAWHDNYADAPTDGSAWMAGGNQSLRVLRGGSWVESPGNLRSANRGGFAPGDRYGRDGFRIARTVP